MQNVVLVPGLLCTEALYDPQIAALSDVARFTVANHRGHDTMEAIATAVLATAPETFVLAGLSMGGYIAFEVLRQAPDRVTGLVLLDTSARADLAVQKEQRQGFMDQVRVEGLEPVVEAFMPMMVHPDRLSDVALVETIRTMGRETGIDAYLRQQTAIMERRDNLPFLTEIVCPTLVIVGAEDVVTPVKVAREMADGIVGAQLEVIPDCGHLTTLERPDAVNGLLRGFLESPSAGDK